MTFGESKRLWEIIHPTANYLDGISVDTNQLVNKEHLFDYLLYEYDNMRTIDSNCDTFHDHIINFFNIHRWNIDKLAESTEFEYNPLWNTDGTTVTDYDRGQNVDTTEDRDIDVMRDETIGVTRNDTTNTVRNQADVWTENGTENGTDEYENVNYVSAYNEAPGAGIEDTEHHRDTHEGSYEKNYEKSGTKNEDETIGVIEDEKIDTTENEHTVTQNDLQANQDLDENIDVTVTATGHNGNVSYQSLIEEERKQAQFNIYKWIGAHFSKELLVCVW